MEGDKKKRNPLIGILLGVAFMVLGLLGITIPELAGASTSSGRSFAIFTGGNQYARYEKTCHDFRKFGVVEMQRQGINQEVIRYLMGQKADIYSSWGNRYDELLEIY